MVNTPQNNTSCSESNTRKEEYGNISYSIIKKRGILFNLVVLSPRYSNKYFSMVKSLSEFGCIMNDEGRGVGLTWQASTIVAI
jgi:hypothetical protein